MRHRHGKHSRKKLGIAALIPLGGAMALTPIMVHPGDTLSGIASSHGVSLGAVERANPQIANPDLIYAGQKVNIPGTGDHSSGSGGGAPAAPKAKTAPRSAPASSSDLADVPGVPRAFAKCVAFRESSNNPQSVNSVPGFEGMGGGAYGIMDYVWQGSDLNKSGQPYDAPLSEQKEAFSILYGKYGSQPWTPSDHCVP